MKKPLDIILTISGILGILVYLNKLRVKGYLNDMRLSKNFVLGEFVKTATGLDNVPGQTEIENIRSLVVNVLQPLRDVVGKPIIVSSGYRSPLVNAAIGGAKSSQHLKGQAADFHIKGLTNQQIIDTLIKNNIPFDQVIDEQLYRSSGRLAKWVHISYNRAGNRFKVSKARNTPDNLKPIYTHYFL